MTTPTITELYAQIGAMMANWQRFLDQQMGWQVGPSSANDLAPPDNDPLKKGYRVMVDAAGNKRQIMTPAQMEKLVADAVKQIDDLNPAALGAQLTEVRADVDEIATSLSSSRAELTALVDSATSSKNAAASSATAASSSKTAAASSATAAASSATAASSSKTAAASSATAAAASQGVATTKASESQASAAESANKAADAAVSASTASTKAGEASASASTASTKASEAASSATSAASSATAASSSATAAAGSATAAKTSETNANTKASAAATSAVSAQKWADNAVDSAVTTGKFSALHHATKASESATAAAASANTSLAKASEASGHASSASTSASTATTKASEAAAGASTATAKATAAASSATSAASSATAAGNSATAAASSATAAANSATAASSSKTAAASSAADAAASAQAAREAMYVSTGALIEAGEIDMSGGAYPAPLADAAGRDLACFWKVTTAGISSLDGVDYEVGDTLVYSSASKKFYKIDNTESVQSVNGMKGAVRLTAADVGALGSGATAVAAAKLAVARTISITGDGTGSASFDGTGNVSISLAVTDDSHAHTFANLKNRPTTLAGFGITDAATSSHVHADLFSKSGGSITGQTLVNIASGPTIGGTSFDNGWLKIGSSSAGIAFDPNEIAVSGNDLSFGTITNNIVSLVVNNVRVGEMRADGLYSMNSKVLTEAAGAAVSAGKLTTARALALTGDATGSLTFDGSADASMAVTLANSGVTAGTFTKVTVDAKGRVTAATTQTAADIPALDWSKITSGKPTNLTGYGISSATLKAIEGLAMAADKAVYFTAAGTAAAMTVTGAARALLDDADSAAMRATLGAASTSAATTTANGLMSAADKAKLDSVQASANAYVHPASGVVAGSYRSVTVDGNGHVTGGSNPTTLNDYGITDAAPSSHVGAAGAAHGAATASVAGFMSAADKAKLDGIAASANNYSHPTGDGNLHVPATGTANNAKFLRAGATAGALSWAALVAADIPELDWSKITSGKPTTLAGYGITDALGINANAVSATKLLTARTFTFTGDSTGSASFDGTANVTINLVGKASGVTAGTYRSVTVDAQGYVTVGANPTTLAGYGITDAQAKHNNLTALSGVTAAADALPYFTSTSAASVTTLTAFARTFLDDADAATARATLGVLSIEEPYKSAADVATTVNLAATYANGSSGVGATLTASTPAALTIDGVTCPVGFRVLVKNQTSTAQNGIYTVTTAGSSTVAWVLTRATDADTTAKLAGAVVTVDQGAGNGSLLFSSDWKKTSTVGTTAMNWRVVVDSGNIGSQHHLSGVAARTYRSVTVNTQGHVTGGTNPTTLAGYGITDALGINANAVSASKWATARTITLTGDVTGSVSIDGSANVSITTVIGDDSHNHTIANVDGLQSALDGKLASGANAVSATKLLTARTINGTSFDGTASITTANWGTARTLTIGNAGKSVNGSADVAWSLNDIGAVSKAGDVMDGNLDAPKFTSQGVEFFGDGAWAMIKATGKEGVILHVDTAQQARVKVGTNGSVPIYHALNKPSSDDVGLGNVNNWAASGAVNLASDTTYATAGAVKKAYDLAAAALPSSKADVFKSAGMLTDLNVAAAAKPGFFQYSSGAVGAPMSGYGHGLVVSTGGNPGSGNWYQQIAFGHDAKIYTRRGVNSAATGAWARIYTTEDKPSLAELGAAAVDHTHTYSYSLRDIKDSPYKEGCDCATTANLAAAYVNGSSGVGATLTNNSTLAALTIDGVTCSAGMRVLVKNQTSAAQNGIYTVTNAGSASEAWVLTRTPGCDTSAEAAGAVVTVDQGTANGGLLVTTEFKRNGVIGTTAMNWRVVVDSGNIGTQHHASGASAGTYRSVTVNAQGHVTAGTNPTTLAGYGITDALGLNANAVSATKLATSRTISTTGDATGSASFDGTANAAIALTLANSGVAAGTYTKVTVDAKGRVTSGSAMVAADVPNLDWSKITSGKPTTLAGYGITDAQAKHANLTALAGVSPAADRIPYFTSASAASVTPLTAFARSLLDDNDAAAARATLGVLSIEEPFKSAADVATTADLAATYANGSSGVGATLTASAAAALVLDGVTCSVGMRVLVKNQTAAAQNGVYTVTNAGSSTVAWVLTRATDADTTAKLAGAVVTVDQGTVNGSMLLTNDWKKTSVVGTTAMNWRVVIDSGNVGSYHHNSGATAGTYRSVTVNAQGHVTAGTNPTTLSGYGITDAAPSSHVGAGGGAHSVATSSLHGFMSSTDKAKLDSIASNANNYAHPAGDGNLHVPATGTSNNGKYLMAGATAGSLSWQSIDAAEVGAVPVAGGAMSGVLTVNNEIRTTSANSLRMVYGNYGTFWRQDGSNMYLMFTNAGDQNGSYNGLRPMYANLANGNVNFGHAVDVAGNLSVNTGSTSWIDMRASAAFQSRSAVAAGSASAIVRQEHADRHFILGGLGNSCFGVFMINKSRTANGTDAGAYLSADGTWYCGANVSANDYQVRSDRRLKSDFKEIKDTWDLWKTLQISEYTKQGVREYGFIAQDFEKDYKPAIAMTMTDDYLNLKPMSVLAIAGKVIQSLQDRVENLENMLKECLKRMEVGDASTS